MKKRSAITLAVACALGAAVAPAEAHWVGEVRVFVAVGTCGAGREASVFWNHRPGNRIPESLAERPVLQASWNGYNWINVRRLPFTATAVTFNVDRLRNIAHKRDPRYSEDYQMTELGYVTWHIRATLPSLGYHGPTTDLVIDESAPAVSILSPKASNPTVEDAALLNEPLAVVRGKTTLHARAIDDGVGFGQTVNVAWQFWDRRPGVIWTLLNETTGKTTVIESSEQKYYRIDDRQVFDFSAEPGVYNITALAEDCVGNRASDTIRVLGT